LPGIVLAFLLSGSRQSAVMFVGACVTGLLTTFLIEIFHRKLRLQSDAAIGITFTSLFAIGVILVSLFSGQIDLDQDCVLYGEIVYVPLDVVSWFGVQGVPRAAWSSLFVLVVICGCIAIAYKELFLTTFDAAFAAALGVSVQLWHYVLMSLVSLVAVSSFESVGAILVVALLVVPPATALLLTDSFPMMLVIAALLLLLADMFLLLA
jgi:manganese/zinc/iron transport system permease protein